MRRRGDLTGWILMGVLFIGAMALIFYILLLRAQHLASMEQQRENPDPEANIEQFVAAQQPLVMHVASGDNAQTPHMLLLA